MNVLMISPGFPFEIPLFTSALPKVGATVFGVGDQPAAALAPEVQQALDSYLQVRNLWDEEHVVGQVRDWLRGRRVDRVEALWEPAVVLAARLREALGAPGLRVEHARAFRDKEHMKKVLDAAGIRTPHHYKARTRAEVETATDRIGYPVIVKPIAGAGSAQTFPIRDKSDLERAIGQLRDVPEVSVEEYIEGEEYTYDTVSAGGKPLFENVSWYLPGPLVARLNPWISPQCLTFRDLTQEVPAKGVAMGRRVLEALRFDNGFTHMEWFVKRDGEPVFGEIAARSPGGRLVHLMNYSCDIDLFRGWAEAICHGRLSQDTSKKYCASVIFKKAQGKGPLITRITGLDSILNRFGEHIAAIELNRVGQPKRDWRQIVSGDGWIVVRHPEFETALAMSNAVASDVVVWAD